jgi:hypothetical protein
MRLELMTQIADRKRRSRARSPFPGSELSVGRARLPSHGTPLPGQQPVAQAEQQRDEARAQEGHDQQRGTHIRVSGPALAHCRYQPSPAFTPSISATTRTANELPCPMVLLTPATPDQVNTVTGNPVATAIRKMLALKLDRNTNNASGN